MNILTLDTGNTARAKAHLKRVDPRLGKVIDELPDCEIHNRRTTLFDMLAGSIVGQQLSTRAAATIYRRVCDLTGANRLTALAVRASTTPALRAAGLSKAKTKAIQTLAAAVAEGSLSLRSLARREDPEVISALTQLPGIGLWTAQMFLMFALRRADILSTGDLGLQKGLQRLDGLEDKPSTEEFEARAEIWAPYRSVASWYLWRLLELPEDKFPNQR
ncbi:MAG: DNA-3-methyladenine glycosylase 2 family protein [Pseudomonadota bacterium]